MILFLQIIFFTAPGAPHISRGHRHVPTTPMPSVMKALVLKEHLERYVRWAGLAGTLNTIGNRGFRPEDCFGVSAKDKQTCHNIWENSMCSKVADSCRGQAVFLLVAVMTNRLRPSYPNYASWTSSL